MHTFPCVLCPCTVPQQLEKDPEELWVPSSSVQWFTNATTGRKEVIARGYRLLSASWTTPT